MKLTRLARAAVAATAATAAVAMLAGCTGGATAADTPSGAQSLRIGYLPQDETPHFAAARQGLATDLAAATGLEVSEYHVADMSALVEAMRHGHVDMAIVGAMGVVQAYQVADSFPLVAMQQEEGPLHSDIIVRADSGIHTIADLMALDAPSIAFVDHISTTGTLLPAIGIMEAFPERDLDFDDILHGDVFSTVVFAGGHPNVAQAVIQGDAVAGGIAHRQTAVELERLGLSEDYLRVIHRSEPVMGATMVASSSLDADLIEVLRDFLVGFDNEDYFYGMWGNRSARFFDTEIGEFADLFVIDEMLG
ncbi:phosphate/phosphite/phosphonate ABC transporter substrate-binding protein [Xylanimonas ulmi]|uniref:Phosphate/phosphite/phosphonate ABC transporter binding protein n=1 Tax=Xylanimonas ulmi TaxID=228973 RepID=A0A4Q7M0W7_9MICO|nr:phosphate/phosphite/phosphonate ABC transporter substrate-binding protein [Xylanibacterium ulmi]RZS61426.1 phosphate/phosphite/phosphonate ABC transporter binding protein [Xylanibacterium ulmi]